eukprot:m.21001 g.21001  ORF g.21001 m.21001 type:complete len:222 (-) comp8234_c0_seq3:940-1605(-)
MSCARTHAKVCMAVAMALCVVSVVCAKKQPPVLQFSSPAPVLMGQPIPFTLTSPETPLAEVTVTLNVVNGNATIKNNTAVLDAKVKVNHTFIATSTVVGETTFNLSADSSDKRYTVPVPGITVSVVKSTTVVTINAIIGWVYFLAWSISFYPQIWVNYRSKCVIGLNFDFLAFNITGFVRSISTSTCERLLHVDGVRRVPVVRDINCHWLFVLLLLSYVLY